MAGRSPSASAPMPHRAPCAPPPPNEWPVSPLLGGPPAEPAPPTGRRSAPTRRRSRAASISALSDGAAPRSSPSSRPQLLDARSAAPVPAAPRLHLRADHVLAQRIEIQHAVVAIRSICANRRCAGSWSIRHTIASKNRRGRRPGAAFAAEEIVSVGDLEPSRTPRPPATPDVVAQDVATGQPGSDRARAGAGETMVRWRVSKRPPAAAGPEHREGRRERNGGPSQPRPRPEKVGQGISPVRGRGSTARYASRARVS